jgi:zinc transporter ZupT
MSESESRKPSRVLVLASALVPLLAVLGILYWYAAGGARLNLAAPAPIETLAFERVVLRPGSMQAHVMNAGPEPVTIAQVQVGWLNRASWEFHVSPSPTIPRLGRAVVDIPYPWTPGEPYEIVLITESSLIFTHDIEVAAETPAVDLSMMGQFAMLGIYVGVLPVFLGIAWLPFLRTLSSRWYHFLLNLTTGLLVFLGFDALEEAFEAAGDVPGPYQGPAIILIGLSLSLGLLYAVSGWLRRRQEASAASGALVLAYSVAFGIGVHNLGEGLAIGGAYALGEFAAGALLILGFTLHNLTEGVAVVAPIVQSKVRWLHLVWLGALAGLPTIAGTLLGAFAYTATWAVLFLAIGAGAVFQVVAEITRYQVRERGAASLAQGFNLAGFAAGLATMYITGLFVTM